MPNVFVLEDHLKEQKDFELKIAGKTYKLPSGNKLKRKDFKLLSRIEKSDMDALYDFLGQYITPEVADELDLEKLQLVYNAWSDFIKESNGVSLGES